MNTDKKAELTNKEVSWLIKKLVKPAYNQGKHYMHMGKIDSALSEFEILPNCANLSDTLIGAWFHVSNEKFLWKFLREIETWGDLFFQEGKYDDAIKCYTLLIEKNYTSANLSTLPIFISSDKTPYERSSSISALESFTSSIYYLRGRAYYEKDDYVGALADFNKAKELGYSLTSVHLGRGCTYFKKDAYAQALAEFALIPDDSIRAEAYSTYGRRFYFADRNYALAIKCCGYAIAIDPKDFYARLVYNIAKMEQQVISELNEKFVESFGKTLTEYYEKGKTLMQEGKVDSALIEFAKSLPERNAENYPEEHEWYEAFFETGNGYLWDLVYDVKNYGDEFLKNKDFDNAIKCYTLLIEKGYVEDFLITVITNRGRAYYEIGEYDKAISDFETALTDTLTDDPDEAREAIETLLEQAKQAEKVDDEEKANELANNVLLAKFNHLCETFTTAYNVGNEYMQNGDVERALAEFAKIIPEYHKNNENIGNKHTYGVFECVRDYNMGITNLINEISVCIEEFLKNEEWDNVIGGCTLLITKLKYRFPSKDGAVIYTNRGIAYLRKEEYDNAVKDLKYALDLDRNNPEPDYYLDEIYAFSEEYNKLLPDIENYSQQTNSADDFDDMITHLMGRLPEPSDTINLARPSVLLNAVNTLEQSKTKEPDLMSYNKELIDLLDKEYSGEMSYEKHEKAMSDLKVKYGIK